MVRFALSRCDQTGVPVASRLPVKGLNDRTDRLSKLRCWSTVVGADGRWDIWLSTGCFMSDIRLLTGLCIGCNENMLQIRDFFLPSEWHFLHALLRSEYRHCSYYQPYPLMVVVDSGDGAIHLEPRREQRNGIVPCRPSRGYRNC